MKKILFTALLALSFFVTSGSLAQISPPTLQAPLNGATNVSTTPLFNWTDVAGATSYSIQVFTGVTPVINVGGLTVSQYQVTTPPLQPNTQYYWRAAAVNGPDTAWSGYFNFTTTISAPAPPTLSQPPNGATNVTTTPTFIWNPSSGATTYHIQVATDIGFTNPTINVPGLTSTQYVVTTPPLANGTLFYWRVSASNLGGTSDWSTVWNISTVPAPPPPPTLQFPSNGATGVSLTPTLNWSDVFGATAYRVQVSTSPAFGTLIIDETVSVSQYSVPPGVFGGGVQYFWRVYSINIGGQGPHSVIFNFTTQPGLPAAPLLLTPLDSAEDVPRNPFFDWSDVAGATSYRIHVSTDPGFGSTIINVSLVPSQYQAATVLAYNTRYYWRVNATNFSGTGPWSNIRTFLTVSQAPPPPVLVSPPNGATGVSLTVTLDWNASSGATSYRVQVSTNLSFGSPVVNSVVTGTEFPIPPGTLIGNQIYYWRVNATNAGGTSAYSTIWNFTTIQTLTSNLKVYLEGFYNGTTQVRDTIKVYLANSTSPYAFRDSSRVYLEENGTGTTSFQNAPNGNYYIVIKHRNHIETWSALPQFFQTGTIVNYDFTTGSNKAYGNNMKQVGSVWVLWGGDINQDGSVDPADYTAYITQFGKDGYISSDLNGNDYADGYDLPILYNNFGKSKARP